MMKFSVWSQRVSLFQKALVFSIVLHVLIFGIRIYNPGNVQAYFVQTPLEVILVNAHSEEAPQKAQAIAQNQLNGGGQNDGQLSSTPLPRQNVDIDGNSLQNQAARMQALMVLQARLLVQKKKELNALLQEDSESATKPSEQSSQTEKRIRLSKQIAAIERRINEQNSRPRLRYLSPATQSVPYALYYSALRAKIEEAGTLHFPTHEGKKLYGGLVMEIVVLANGSLKSASVVRSSGNPVLDQKARDIVRGVGAFAAFPADIRKSADLIAVITHFQFARNGSLLTRQQAQ